MYDGLLDVRRIPRAAGQAGVKIAVSRDAQSTREFGLIYYGIDQTPRAAWKKLPC
jgi:hypothetical protein